MEFLPVFQTYKIPIISGAISVFSIIVSIILLVKSTQTNAATPIQFSSEMKEASSAGMLMVDVEGAVVRPGVYALPAGSRVDDTLASAGGLEENVDEELFAKTINRAAKITDGQKIYVPAMSIDETSHINGSVVATSGTSQNGLVSVNFATAAELDVLPGVGPVIAQKIIDNRPYQSLDDLVTKKAIGPVFIGKTEKQPVTVMP